MARKPSKAPAKRATGATRATAAKPARLGPGRSTQSRRRPSKRRSSDDLLAWLPLPARAMWDELQDRVERLPNQVNEYGYDPFGYDPSVAAPAMLPISWIYRNWFRCETTGIEHVPEGRAFLIPNHAGNTFAFDAAMLQAALFLEGEPPRIARAMGEYFLPRVPWLNVLMQRGGAVVGTPENCRELLLHDEVVTVFPEGERGFLKPYSQAYELQRFGLGFMRLALETGTPIVPVGIVGSEEHSPGIARVEWLGKLIGAPAVPLTPTFPFLGPVGALPLPVKFRIHIGEAMRFEGDPNDDDAVIERLVEEVKHEIRALIDRGLSERSGWFR